MVSKHFSLYWTAPHLAKEIWWFCIEYNLWNIDFVFVIWMSLNWASTLLNCKHIENTNTSFCMHNQVVKNATIWPSTAVDLHTHNFEVLWMRQSKTSKILFELDNYYHSKQNSKQYILGFLFELFFERQKINTYRYREREGRNTCEKETLH